MDVMGVAFIKDLPDRFGMAETIFISVNVPAVTSTDQFFKNNMAIIFRRWKLFQSKRTITHVY